MKIQENISLKEFTTFKIGGPAKFFARVKSSGELVDALKFALERTLPIFVLGGGSNILISDTGFPGLVIKNEIGGIDYSEAGSPDRNEVSVGAGIDWDFLVSQTVSRGLYGMENLSFIPGTVGAAPVQNIGAYGVEVKDVLTWVEAYHLETGAPRRFTNAECQFGYRNSFFKTPEGKKYIITRVGFNLKKTGQLNTSYKDVAEYLSIYKISEPTLADIRKIIIEIRTKKLPSLKEYGTAGSFFKNPTIPDAQYQELLKKYPDLPGFKSDAGVKVSLTWIIDHVCGLKDFQIGNAGTYKTQPLTLVTFADTTAKEVKILAQKIALDVKQKTDIEISREVEYVG